MYIKPLFVKEDILSKSNYKPIQTNTNQCKHNYNNFLHRLLSWIVRPVASTNNTDNSNLRSLFRSRSCLSSLFRPAQHPVGPFPALFRSRSCHAAARCSVRHQHPVWLWQRMVHHVKFLTHVRLAGRRDVGAPSRGRGLFRRHLFRMDG